jgi:hypothetical protein
MLELESMLDPLRGDPRFQRIIDRVRGDVEAMRRTFETNESDPMSVDDFGPYRFVSGKSEGAHRSWAMVGLLAVIWIPAQASSRTPSKRPGSGRLTTQRSSPNLSWQYGVSAAPSSLRYS